jgi:hypothetical protein
MRRYQFHREGAVVWSLVFDKNLDRWSIETWEPGRERVNLSLAEFETTAYGGKLKDQLAEAVREAEADLKLTAVANNVPPSQAPLGTTTLCRHFASAAEEEVVLDRSEDASSSRSDSVCGTVQTAKLPFPARRSLGGNLHVTDARNRTRICRWPFRTFRALGRYRLLQYGVRPPER